MKQRLNIYTSTVLLLMLCAKPGLAQSRFTIGIQGTPKLSVNNNTSVPTFGGQNNEADGHDAFAGAIDLQLNGGYRVGQRDFLLLSLGTYNVRQKFRPSFTLYGREYKNTFVNVRFAHIALEYYRQVTSIGKVNIHAGLGLSFVQDMFQNRVKSSELYLKNGDKPDNTKVVYFVNHINMETFNILASCALRQLSG